MAKSFNLKDAKGALIAQIEKDGPADKAGLRDGDVVIEYNGKPIADIRELSQAVASTKPGAKVKVKAMREGKPVNLVIVVGEMRTEKDLNEVVSKAKGSLAVLVDRNGSREFIPVKLSDEAKK